METLKELMQEAVHEFMDSDGDNDRHISNRIVRRYTPQYDGILVEEVHITRINTGEM